MVYREFPFVKVVIKVCSKNGVSLHSFFAVLHQLIALWAWGWLLQIPSLLLSLYQGHAAGKYSSSAQCANCDGSHVGSSNDCPKWRDDCVLHHFSIATKATSRQHSSSSSCSYLPPVEHSAATTPRHRTRSWASL